VIQTTGCNDASAPAITTFVPRLRRAGVGDATIHRILVENPRRLLAFVPKATSDATPDRENRFLGLVEALEAWLALLHDAADPG
jgi:hypothetical protein